MISQVSVVVSEEDFGLTQTQRGVLNPNSGLLVIVVCVMQIRLLEILHLKFQKAIKLYFNR